MRETELQCFTKKTQGMRLFQQERAILQVTELICQLMQEQGVSRSQLAKRLGKTNGYVTQLLDGETNMTLRTVSDVFLCLGHAVSVEGAPIKASVTQRGGVARNVSLANAHPPDGGMLRLPVSQAKSATKTGL
ncbi:MAG: helix-turn-helix transcriptional regulator [Planctomycetota bacterium]|nr:helix-turn-helix transcriptional regulator [Planctomycetota bacterium]